MILRIKTRILYILNKCSTTEPYFKPFKKNTPTFYFEVEFFEVVQASFEHVIYPAVAAQLAGIVGLFSQAQQVLEYFKDFISFTLMVDYN